jgi:cytochrome c
VRHLPLGIGGCKRYRPDIVRRGRPAGGVPGFQYTADHKKLGVTSDAATLDKYLTNPRAMVPDTTMIYAGLKDGADRANLIAYLETLH